MWHNLRYDWPLHLVLLVTAWLPDNVIFLRLRGWLAHFFFAECGKDLRLGRRLSFYNPAKIKIGSRVYIAYGNWFSAAGDIVLEDEVILGPYSVYASANHTRQGDSYRFGPASVAPIHIGRGTWVAAHCIVTAGVTIGKAALIAAGCVVTSNVPEKVLFAGNPGKVISPRQ